MTLGGPDLWRVLLQLLGNTSPLELLVGVVGLVVSFFATVVATAIGVAIALWTQRRDFAQRRDELLLAARDQQQQAADRARQEMADRLIEFVVVLEENAIGVVPALDDDATQRLVDGYYNRFKYWPEPDGMNVFSAMHTSWLAMRTFRSLPLDDRKRRTHAYASLLQTNLVRWASGEITAATFPPVGLPR